MGLSPEQPPAELGRASYILLRAASSKPHITKPEIYSFPTSRDQNLMGKRRLQITIQDLIYREEAQLSS